MPQLNKDTRHAVTIELNGRLVSGDAEPRMLLSDFLISEIGVTSAHVGCEHGVCGACTLLIDGTVARACLTLAVQADGLVVETIEGVSDSGEIADLQEAFIERNALQCGFCTPGMLLTAAELLAREPTPDRARIREFLSGNYCRCTGYQAIIDAVETTAKARASGAGS